jgi:adenylate kinase family enzyme
LKVFNDQTKPVIDFYQKQNKLQRFDANREVAVITDDVEKHLDSLGIFPAN